MTCGMLFGMPCRFFNQKSNLLEVVIVRYFHFQDKTFYYNFYPLNNVDLNIYDYFF